LGLETAINGTIYLMPTQLRPEILQQRNDDGLVSFLDPILQQKYHLNIGQSQEFLSGEWSDSLVSFLEAAMLLEGLGAEAIRRTYWNSKSMVRAVPENNIHVEPDWSLLENLPNVLQEQWKGKEPWRRILEQARAGNRFFLLENFIRRAPMLAAIEACDFQPYQTNFLKGKRCRVSDGLLVQLMADSRIRQLFSSILNMPLTGEILAHGWKLENGDYIGSHIDGTKYIGTLTLGGNQHWKASNGGAFTFGTPGRKSFQSEYRWIPELGNALLFRPRSDLWHAVEEVQSGTRYTMTGWWLEDGVPVHHH